MPPILSMNWPGLLIIGFCFNVAYAQVHTEIYHCCKFDSAGVSFIKGEAWQQGLSHLYDSLPEKSKTKLTPSLWSLSENTAREYIALKTDASSIIIRYKTASVLSMPHMPATGVSGVDLYGP